MEKFQENKILKNTNKNKFPDSNYKTPSKKRIKKHSFFQNKENYTYKKSTIPESQIKTTIPRKAKKKKLSKHTKIALLNKNHEKIFFDLYNDIDLGFKRKHQILIHSSNMDNDCCTDEEQLDNAIDKCVYDLKLAIKKNYGQFLEREDFGSGSDYSSGDSY